MQLRRRAVAGLLALASGLAAADVPPWNRAEQQRLLAEGEARLQAGDIDAAQRALERAALTGHAADVELVQLRAMMQAGEYRQALAFAAHVAGAHLDASAGAVMYVWLLRLGGQDAVARQVLDAAIRRLPDDPTLVRVPDWWSGKDTAPTWLAPYTLGSSAAAEAQVVGSAVLLPDGQHAVAELPEDRRAVRLWLRNGLGRTSVAELVRHDAATGLALLRLVDPLDTPPAWARAPREAFAGSAAYAIGFVANDTGHAAWPQLSIGFLGAGVPSSDARWLGIDVPRGTAGAPVLDPAGRLVGISLPPGADGRTRMLGIAPLEALAGPLPDAGAAPRLGLDEVYERAMRVVLQVLVAPR